MWEILHWYFIYFSNPHPVFHVLVFVLSLAFRRGVQKKRIRLHQPQRAIGLVGMYVGVYMCREIWHFGFLPFWTVCLVGIREKTINIVVVGVVVGVVLQFVVLSEVAAHAIMNVARCIKIKNSMNTLILAHGALSCLVFSRPFECTSREVIAVASALHTIHSKERMDVFSICMCFSRLFALLIPLTHVPLWHWFDKYENNHFYMVKHQRMWVILVAILLQRLYYAVRV